MLLSEFKDIKHFHPSVDPKLKNYAKITFRVVRRADVIREYADVPLIVSSADRSRGENSKDRSRHLTVWGNQARLCNALDLIPADVFDFEKLVMAGLRSSPPGFGVYENGSVHIDERPGSPARWCYLEGKYVAWTWENLEGVIRVVRGKRGGK